MRISLPAVFSKGSMLRSARRCIGEGKWQVAISCAFGVAGAVFSFTAKHHSDTTLLTFSSYFTFLIGIAAVTILVNSMTVGLLLYSFQSISAGQNYYYDKFRGAAAALRDNLDSLHTGGFISSEYDNSYREIELLTMERLPVGWKESFVPFLENLSSELHDNLEAEDGYDRILGTFEVNVVVLNEAVSGLWTTMIRRVLLRSGVSPVVKSIWTLALTIFAVLIGAVYFSGVSAHILDGLAIGIGCMTILLILEIGSIAVAESKEFFDDNRDVDHSGTESSAQVSGDATRT